MLDNICSLPLSSDLFAQAIHPTSPLFCVGLSSGHVETYKLPALDHLHDKSSSSTINGQSKPKAHRLSEHGFDVVESLWRTRRHKGSCRSLAYSLDGDTLFSAGSDGLIKLAQTETGRVTAKIAIPAASSVQDVASPSILSPLSPQVLLLGTDTSSIHIYDIRTPSNAPTHKPSQSFRPHDTQDDPNANEAISSVTSLPPTATSTSGTSKSCISTSGSTLGVTDFRKGVIATSEDQGDLLLSSTCLPALASSGPSSKRKAPNGSSILNSSSATDRVVIGTMSGNLSVWDRGNWTDRTLNIPLASKKVVAMDDQEIEQVTLVPSHVRLGNSNANQNTIAAGMSNGTISFIKILSKAGGPIGHVIHDDQTVDGITALGFDVTGRMISGGGQLVKIWHEKSITPEDELETEQESQNSSDSDQAAGDVDQSEDESGSEQDVEPPKQEPKKRRRDQGSQTHGHHGIMAFEGMD